MIPALSGTPSVGVRVLIATRPGDFRRGADSLAAMVQLVLGQDPFCGTVFVFRSKRADRVKMLVYDGTGLVLIWKRLEGAKFRCCNGRQPIQSACSRRCRSPARRATLLRTSRFMSWAARR